jgi:FixJ family two-component response regulator
MKLGAIDFILKPFEIDDLISSITRAIEIDMARVL